VDGVGSKDEDAGAREVVMVHAGRHGSRAQAMTLCSWSLPGALAASRAKSESVPTPNLDITQMKIKSKFLSRALLGHQRSQ